MAKAKKAVAIVDEAIIKKIIFLREEKVILNVHLAELYGVQTRALKQAVRRNIERFPEDFMSKLTEDEVEAVASRNLISHKKYLSGAAPFAFTETGVAMPSSVLKAGRPLKQITNG